MAAVEPLTAWELEQLRCILERERDELVQYLEGLAQDSGPVILDQQLQGRLSRMDAMQQQAMSEAGERQARLHIVKIKRALLAIDQDEYGYCSDCDGDIGYGRLTARPEATLCVQCARKIEKS